MVTGAVVAEQVELQVDRVGAAQALHERRERPRARELVDEAEQVGGALLGVEGDLLDEPGDLGRNGGARGGEPVRAEIEGVVVLVQDRRHAHQHLGGLGDVDLDPDGPRTRQVEHLRSTRFDGHLTVLKA